MKFDKDINNQEILLDKQNDQTMMEWERPLMDAEVDMLQPKGHVLELGFGLGMSADAIQKYKPKSHTIIELEDDVFERAKLWASNKNNINLIKGRWQDVMHKLHRQVYDETFFDVTETGGIENYVDAKLIEYWTYIFVDLWFHHHSKVGSKLTFFVADFNWPNTYNYQKLIAENPNWIHTYKMIDIEVPENCTYRNINKAVVNLLERTTIKTPKNIYRY
jgi:hypothetical protein